MTLNDVYNESASGNILKLEYVKVLAISISSVSASQGSTSSLQVSISSLSSGLSSISANVSSSQNSISSISANILSLSGSVTSLQNNLSSTGLKFGLSGDTNLYRNAPNTLKTDSNLVVNGYLSMTGVIVGGAVYNASTGVSSSITIDWKNGNWQKFTCANSTGIGLTITMINPPTNGGKLTLEVIYGSSCSRDSFSWINSGYTLRWVGGTVPGIPSGSNKIDIFVLMFDGVNYIGSFAMNS